MKLQEDNPWTHPEGVKLKKTDSTNCWQGRATSVACVLCQGRTNPHELGWPLSARVCFYAHAHTWPVCLHVVTKAGFVGAKTQRHHGQWKQPSPGRWCRRWLSGSRSAWSLRTTKWIHGDRNQTWSTETWISGRVLASCDQSPNAHPTPTKRHGKEHGLGGERGKFWGTKNVLILIQVLKAWLDSSRRIHFALQWWVCVGVSVYICLSVCTLFVCYTWNLLLNCS